MQVIDAQLHPVVPAIAWEFGDTSRLAMVTELTREAMDCVGVDMALLTSELEVCDYAVGRYPARFVGVITYFDESGTRQTHERERDVETLFTAYLENPGTGAVRTGIVNWRDGSLARGYQSGALDRVFETAERVGAPLFLFASGQPGEVANIARTYPSLQIIVDHLGLPQTPMPVADDPWALLPISNSLAEYDNVTMKFCGGPTLSRESYPHADIWPHLTTVLEAYGPDRLMWGSDMTRMRMKPGTNETGERSEWASTYADSVGYIRDTDRLSAADKEELLAGTVRRVLNLSAPGQ
jgi:L-fuconolactonase